MSDLQIQQLLATAAEARRSGNAEAFLQAVKHVLEIDPTEPQARNALGHNALARSDFAEAAEHFETAASRDPSAIALWLNLATARRGMEDDEGERRALEQVLGLERTHLAGLIRLAQLHERLNEEAKAIELWSGVVGLRAQHMDAPPHILAMFDHASAYVSERNRKLAGTVDAALEPLIAKADERDARRLSAARDAMLGRRAIFTNQPQGFHYPFLPADEYFDRSHFPWFAELEANTAVIRDELAAILASDRSLLQPYVQMESGLPDSKWTALDHNLDWSSLHLWREGTRIDEACNLAPKTAALVERLPLCDIPGRAPTVFFSILKAGKIIPPHTGVTNIRTIIHLPLVVPGECAFRVGGETREWVEGEAFAFDDSIEHEAWNRSGEDRAILILDTWNPHLSEHERGMIRTLFSAADSAGYNPHV